MAPRHRRRSEADGRRSDISAKAIRASHSRKRVPIRKIGRPFHGVYGEKTPLCSAYDEVISDRHQLTQRADSRS
jgi:hypothetical protein